MAYNVAANLRPSHPGAAFIEGRDNALRNALAERQVASAEQAQQFSQQNALMQQDRQARADQWEAQDRGAASEAANENRRKIAAQRAFVLAQNLDAAKSPDEFNALADMAAAEPAIQSLGITRDKITPESVRILLSQSRAQAGEAPDKHEQYTLGPGQRRFEGGREVAAVPDGEAESGFTLSPGQVRYGPDGRRVAGVPQADKENDPFDRESKLRTEYNTQSKEFRGVSDAYQRIKDSASNPSAAGDLSLIFNYMKVLDPGSTVREGEFATAQNATGVPGRVLSMYNNVVRGERLNPNQRADFVGRATTLYKGQEKRFKTGVYDRYMALAKAAGVDPVRVVADVGVPEDQSAPAESAGGWGRAVQVP